MHRMDKRRLFHGCLVVTWLSLIALSASPAARGGRRLSASEAKDHIGEVATVCRSVVSARYARNSREHPHSLTWTSRTPTTSSPS